MSAVQHTAGLPDLHTRSHLDPLRPVLTEMDSLISELEDVFEGGLPEGLRDCYERLLAHLCTQE